MKKFCVKCGHEFVAAGREVICPSCKESARQEAKRATVLRAKRASWTGESVPVRISGRASTVIRQYGAAHNLPFSAALDALLKASDFFQGMGVKWEEVEPYKSRCMKKSMDAPQDVTSKPQDIQAASKPQEAQAAKEAASTVKPVKQAAKVTGKTVKTAAGKAASKASKAAKTTSKKEVK